MDKHSGKQEIRVLGIDLGKKVFHLHGATEQGRVGLRKRLSRDDLLPFLANLPPCLIGMEACSGAHEWGRELTKLGHEVKLMAPQFVKPYVKGNKHDFNDAEAICEAVQRGNMRFVALKSEDQQEILAWHRARSLAVGHRTAEINQIRGLLAEFGITVPTGAHQVRQRLPALLEDEQLPGGVRQLLRELALALEQVDARILKYDQQITAMSRQSEPCRLLMTIPGIGVLTASALAASIGEAGMFRNGREVAAWLGLTPRQHSTGGKTRLLGISKRGDTYLRTLLIHGARAALRTMGKKTDGVSRWAMGVERRRGRLVAAVALAAKNARMAWALLSRGEVYAPPAKA